MLFLKVIQHSICLSLIEFIAVCTQAEGASHGHAQF